MTTHPEDFHKQLTLYSTSKPLKETEDLEVSQIGPYPIESLLEKGGMSVLYLATDPNTKQPVAIKVLSSKYLSNQDVASRFINEAEIIAMANHPNIVKLLGHGFWEGGVYIAMEYIQGISLRQYLVQTPISLKRALKIVLDIAYALCHLHTHGVIHRDLKPENILITESGQIKVIDFGIAQLLKKESQTNKLVKRLLIGTPIYMSPEQKAHPESVSYPSDIYSLGIITYELVLGKLSQGQLHLSLMPKGLKKILTKALQPKPELRYQDLVDFITDLSAYLYSEVLEDEQKTHNQITGLAETMVHAQEHALEKKPDWQNIDVRTFLLRSGGFSGGGLTHYSKTSPHYMIFAEPFSLSGQWILDTLFLQGTLFALEETIKDPLILLKTLNKLLKNHLFSLTLLQLFPESNQCLASILGHHNLWLIEEGEGAPKKVGKAQIALGIDDDLEPEQVAIDWNEGNTLMVHTYATLHSLNEKNQSAAEKTLEKLFTETSQKTSPQTLLESGFRKIKTIIKKPKTGRSIAIVTLSHVSSGK